MKLYAVIENKKYLVDECSKNATERLKDFSNHSKGIFYYLQE
jgi:hypothetical protein